MTWTETRLKYLARVPITSGLGEAGAYDDPSWPRYVRTTDIAGPTSLRNDTFASLPPATAEKATLAYGDILMTTAGATIGKSTTYLSDDPACYAGFLARFRAKPGVDRRFVAYWMQSTPYWDQIATGAVRSTIDNFSAGRYQNLTLVVPEETEQRRIADFLDHQVARLDRAIALRQRQHKLAQERLEGHRDALIDELNAQYLRIGQIANFLTDGDWIESPYITDLGIRLIQTGNVGRGEYRDQGFRYISDQTFIDLNCTPVLPGDVLISRLSPPVGRACLAPASDEPMIASVDVAILRSEIADHRYLVHYFSTRRYLELVSIASRGATMARISRSQLASFSAPMPDRSIQLAIADRLDEAAKATAQTTRVLASSIELLQERKQALITAAVTGQFDVTTARAVA